MSQISVFWWIAAVLTRQFKHHEAFEVTAKLEELYDARIPTIISTLSLETGARSNAIVVSAFKHAEKEKNREEVGGPPGNDASN